MPREAAAICRRVPSSGGYPDTAPVQRPLHPLPVPLTLRCINPCDRRGARWTWQGGASGKGGGHHTGLGGGAGSPTEGWKKGGGRLEGEMGLVEGKAKREGGGE